MRALPVAEVLVSVAALGGWLFLTHAAWMLTGAAVVWPISGGLLLLSLAGWKLLAVIAWEGLYSLAQDEASFADEEESEW